MTSQSDPRGPRLVPGVPPHFSQVHASISRLSLSFPGGGAAQVYLIRGEKLALVDTSVAWSPDLHIAPAMREIGLDFSQIEFVVNTHGDFDHLGGNAAVQRASGAKILIHSSDAIYTRSAQPHADKAREPFEKLGLQELASRRASFAVEMVGASVGADGYLEDGDSIDLGGGVRLRVIHAPGHTAGSISLYWEDERVLLTGDAVQGRGSRCGGLPIYESVQEYRRSLERLAGLPVQHLLLGHWFLWKGAVPSPTREFEEVGATIEDSYQTTMLIERAVDEAMLEAKGRTMLEVAQVACGKLLYQLPLRLDRDTGLPGHGVRTLVAHILEQSPPHSSG